MCFCIIPAGQTMPHVLPSIINVYRHINFKLIMIITGWQVWPMIPLIHSDNEHATIITHQDSRVKYDNKDILMIGNELWLLFSYSRDHSSSSSTCTYFHTVRCLLFFFLASFCCFVRNVACSGELKFWKGTLVCLEVDFGWVVTFGKDKLEGSCPWDLARSIFGKMVWRSWECFLRSKKERRSLMVRMEPSWLSGIFSLNVVSQESNI